MPDIDAWRGVRRLLAVRLDNLGDVLMSTPALAALKASLPGLHTTLLAAPAGAALAPHLPGLVDEVIVHAAPWVQNGKPSTPQEDRALVDRLAAGRFDAAVVFTVCTQSALPAALLLRLAGIPLRLAHSRENPYDLLSDWRRETDLPIEQARHEVRRQLDLVASVGCTVADERLRFALRPADQASLDARLQALGVAPSQPLLLVHPGATAASRRYPAERFGLAAAAVARASGLLPVWTGGEGERALVEQGRGSGGGPSISLAGALSLGELAALVARAELLISNNSGPAHLAAALGTPVVDLYALTNPQHTPWQVPQRVLNHDVPCRNCLKSSCPLGHHDCLQQVPVEAVIGAALSLLAERRAAAAGRPPSLSSPLELAA